MFPHHDCRSQSEALSGKPLAKYWRHTGPVTVDGLAMSRENKNIVNVRQMLDGGFRGSVIRVGLLSARYRDTLDFGEACMDRNRPKVNAILAFHEYLAGAAGPAHAAATGPETCARWIQETGPVCAALDDDLDYARAHSTSSRPCNGSNPIRSAQHALEALKRWDRVLGILG